MVNAEAFATYSGRMSDAAPRSPFTRAVAEFGSGFSSLAKGFGFWRVRPGAMLLGLLPALLAGLALVAGFVVLLVFLDPVANAITPFAGEWDPFWRTSLRVLVATALVVTAGILSARVFTALALTIGGPFYERIGLIAEEAYGGIPQRAPIGFWRSLGDMGRIVLRSVLGSVAIGLVSLIPVVGAPLATLLGVLFTAFVVTREFTLQPLQLRGIDPATRGRMLRARRWRALGFGLGVQLCYLVPLGAVLVMPCAVAGGTHLVRGMLGEPTTTTPPQEGKRPVSA